MSARLSFAAKDTSVFSSCEFAVCEILAQPSLELMLLLVFPLLTQLVLLLLPVFLVPTMVSITEAGQSVQRSLLKTA